MKEMLNRLRWEKTAPPYVRCKSPCCSRSLRSLRIVTWLTVKRSDRSSTLTVTASSSSCRIFRRLASAVIANSSTVIEQHQLLISDRNGDWVSGPICRDPIVFRVVHRRDRSNITGQKIKIVGVGAGSLDHRMVAFVN